MKMWGLAGPMPKSELGLILCHRLDRAGVPPPVLEHRFAAPARQWRFDLCWPADGLAVEVEGGTFIGGRHVRGMGYAADLEKYNAAVLRGWRVLRYTGRMIEEGAAVREIRAALGLEPMV